MLDPHGWLKMQQSCETTGTWPESITRLWAFIVIRTTTKLFILKGLVITFRDDDGHF